MPAGYARDTFFTPKATEYLSKLGNVTYNPYDRAYTPDELRKALKGVDIVFSGWRSGMLNEETLRDAKDLKFIAYVAGSLANAVDEAAFEKNIVVLGANCVFAESVAEGCVCYTMVGLRRIQEYSKLLRNGVRWKGQYYNEGIMHRTIGLVGFGAIAKKFVGYLKPFNVNILVYSRHMTEQEAEQYGVTKAELNELFEKSDVVSIHQGLTEKTFHMVGKEQLDRMPDGALLVNTARGAVIDEAALIEVLKTGRIHAVLDVYEEEPPSLDSPLRSLDNVVAIPHMGGPTIDMRQWCVIKLCEDIEKYLSGERDLETLISLDQISNMTQKLPK